MRPTLHGRAGASVDFYVTVTGIPRVEQLDNPRQPGVSMQVVRVELVHEIATCRNCWTDPAVQCALKEARASGVLPRA